MANLNEKQKRFCEEYMIDLNATQSAIRAGYSEDTARQIGSENLSKPVISSYIEQLMLDRSNRTTITADKVLQELARMAFFNVQDVQDDKGNTKPFNEWSRDDLACIQEITETKMGNDDASMVINQKFKASDKKANLELIGKHLRLFTDKVEHSGPNGGPIESSFNFIPVSSND